MNKAGPVALAALLLLAACGSGGEKADGTPLSGTAGSPDAPITAEIPEGQPPEPAVPLTEVPLSGITVLTNEPFYAAAIEPEQIVLRSTQFEEAHVYRRAETAAEGANGRRFAGVAQDGSRIEILVTLEPCIDTMSGARFPMSGKLWIGEVEARGCVRLSS